MFISEFKNFAFFSVDREKNIKVLAELKSCDTAKHVSTDGQFFKKMKLLKLVSVEDSSGLPSTKNSIGYLSDSLLILLIAGFDDLSYRQENICSKFNKVCYRNVLCSLIKCLIKFLIINQNNQFRNAL